MQRPLLTIAHYTIIEARHGRLTWAGALCAIALASIGLFIQALSLIEADIATISMVAPIARLTAVVIIMVFVINGTCKTLEERGLDMILSSPISRPHWIAGRFIGLIVVCAWVALVVGAPLLLFAAFPNVLSWTLSLSFELALIAGLSLMLSVSLKKSSVALLAGAAIYLCARVIGVIQLLQSSNHPGEQIVSLTSRVSSGLIDTLSLLLPRLDLMSQTQWLLTDSVVATNSFNLHIVGAGLAQAIIYGLLVLAVGVFDFERRAV